MQEITTIDLQQYRGMIKELEAITEQIKALYYPVSSPQGKTEANTTTPLPSEPTALAVAQITKLKQRQATLQARVDTIEAWIDSISDQYVSAIVNYHYVQGLTWLKTCYKVYGYYNKNTVRMKVYRYLKEQNED